MLRAFRDGVWVASGPVRFLGLRLTATMTVLQLGDGSLLVHSPLPLSAEYRDQLSALGRVAHLYAPNTFHHQWLGEWAAAFPAARVHAPHELAAKRPDLRIDRFHDQGGTAGFDGVDEVPIRGFRLRETVLVYRPGATAIVTDLVHNIGRPDHAWTRLYTKAMGFYDRAALSRVLRWTSFDDRRAARQSVDALLEHAFEALIVGHGAPIAVDARAVLAAAIAWLPAAATSRGGAGTGTA
jgi:hypothetical protein